MKYSILLILAVFIFLSSCTNQDSDCIEAPEIPVTIEVEIERLEEQFFAAESAGEILDLINAHPILKAEFLGAAQYPSDTLMANQLFRIINNPYTDTLLMEAGIYFELIPRHSWYYKKSQEYLNQYLKNPFTPN